MLRISTSRERASARARAYGERRDESDGGERDRDVGEKTMEHGGAWQRGRHGGDKYRV